MAKPQSRPLASIKEVSEYTGLKPSMLAKLRHVGGGPPYLKLTHKTVRYRWEDVEEWVASKTQESTLGGGAGAA